jgi:hypothetical protein
MHPESPSHTHVRLRVPSPQRDEHGDHGVGVQGIGGAGVGEGVAVGRDERVLNAVGVTDLVADRDAAGVRETERVAPGACDCHAASSGRAQQAFRTAAAAHATAVRLPRPLAAADGNPTAHASPPLAPPADASPAGCPGAHNPARPAEGGTGRPSAHSHSPPARLRAPTHMAFPAAAPQPADSTAAAVDGTAHDSRLPSTASHASAADANVRRRSTTTGR